MRLENENDEPMLRAARVYAERFDFAVFPCQARGKTPHTEHGCKDATKDLAQIQWWWERWPDANIGIATGAISGIIVLDIDPHHTGDQSLVTLVAKYGELPVTPTVLTGGGGRHYYFRTPIHTEIRNSAGTLGPGLDVRGDGGYVIAPPSIHASGNHYEWAPSLGLDEPPIADAPEWLLKLLTKSARCSEAKLSATSAAILEGERNDTLYRVARSLRARGNSQNAMLEALLAENRLKCQPPLPEREVETIVKNAFLQPDRPEFRARAGGTWPDGAQAGIYRESARGLVRVQIIKEQEVEIPLTNFTAHIVADIARDDGAEITRTFEIEARIGERSRTFNVPTAQFAGMRWPTEQMGAQAVVYAGQGTADHTRAAIQLLSGNPASRTVYSHTGWRKLGDAWFYLHVGGGIGATGAVDGVEVDLPAGLARFRLELSTDPAPAVRASLRLFDLGPDRIMVPAYGSIVRAVLGGADFSIFLFGPTGVFKTELAALLQSHFGAGFDSRHLPASFTSTANTNELLAFSAKDAVLVVDELHPPASGSERESMSRDAARLLRSQGNSAGRGRMRADGSLRPAKPPRGLLVATGEELPRGQSVHARLLTVEMRKGDIEAGKLTICQGDAAAGLYAQAIAAFIRWLAPRLDEVRSEFEQLRRDGRTTFHHEHARTADIRAQLTAGYSIFLKFLLETGAIDEAETAQLQKRIGRALEEAATAQKQFAQSAEPTGAFIRLLGSALGSGAAHIADRDGGAPKGLEQACGWRRLRNGTGAQESTGWQPQGARVGWIDGVDLYLNRDAAYRAAQNMAGDGVGIEVSATTLTRRFQDKGQLLSTDAARGTLTVRRTLDGSRREVLHLHASTIGCPSFPQPDQPDQFSTQVDGDGRLAGWIDGRQEKF